MRNFTLLFVLFLPVLSATESKYVREIKDWRAQRNAELKKPDSWLSLAGLFWLKEGENTFGVDASNDIRFPAYKADDFLGALIRTGNKVTLRIKNKGAVTTADGEPVSVLDMQPDIFGDPTIVKHRSLLWFVIIRGQRVGIRLKDVQSHALKEFDSVPSYPIDESWRIQARLEPYNPAKTLKIHDVLGDASERSCPGALVFHYAGKEYRLDPIGDSESPTYFLIFSDETSGDETYGGGRFLSIDRVDENRETFIDFNRAVNPPCAFTPYATCPLPPKGNRLPFKVSAGEKNIEHTDH